MTPPRADVPFVRYYTQDANEDLSDAETAETGDVDRSSADVADQKPGEACAEEGGAV